MTAAVMKLKGPHVPIRRGYVPAMGMCYQTATVSPDGQDEPTFTGEFLVDSGAIDCVFPSDLLDQIGVRRQGSRVYELADGSTVELAYGFARITLGGETTPGRVTFGAVGTEGLIGVTVLETLGLALDPVKNTLIRLPHKSLK